MGSEPSGESGRVGCILGQHLTESNTYSQAKAGMKTLSLDWPEPSARQDWRARGLDDG